MVGKLWLGSSLKFSFSFSLLSTYFLWKSSKRHNGFVELEPRENLVIKRVLLKLEKKDERPWVRRVFQKWNEVWMKVLQADHIWGEHCQFGVHRNGAETELKMHTTRQFLLGVIAVRFPCFLDCFMFISVGNKIRV